jgi:hypothetical protein
MPHNIIEFKEAAGKTVAKVTLTNELDFRAVTIRFTDKTAMHFTVQPRVEFDPELVDWKTGNGKPIKTYRRVHESE